MIAHLPYRLRMIALLAVMASLVAAPGNAHAARDRTAPTAPAKIAASATSATSVKVSWSAARDASGIREYLVFRNGARTPTAKLSARTRSWIDAKRAPSTTYTYVVRARDAAGNLSRASKRVRVRTLKPPNATTPTPGTTKPAPRTTVPTPDRTAPTAPGSLVAVALSERAVSVSWTPSTDDVGIASYVVYRNDVVAGTVGGAISTYVVDGLRPSTAHTFRVRALDAAKNTSSASGSVTVLTLPAPAPPVVEPEVDPAAGLTLHVALGDSFSSGMGSETMPIAPAPGVTAARTVDQSVYETGAGGQRHPCQRTTNNAARRIAAAKGYTLRDVSCAGAVVNDILGGGPQTAGFPAQIDAVTADAALVTLTIGGNDTQLLDLLSCVASVECTASHGPALTTHRENNALQSRITTVLSAIRQRAPYARIRIAGYPYLLPVPGSPLGICGSGLSDAERVLMKTEHDRTNAAIHTAADAADPRVQFVDANQADSPFNELDAGEARDGCATNVNRWLNGAVDSSSPGVGGWHPNALGYGYYAQLYLASL